MKLVADYREVYPDLPILILEFFSIAAARRSQGIAGNPTIQPRTIQEFLQHLHVQKSSPESKPFPQPEPINTICRRLVDCGWLSPAGAAAGPDIGGSQNAYIGILHLGYDRQAVNLQANNAIYGWPSIYDTYTPSVIPVLHKGEDDETSLGTAFIAGPSVIVTAAHCLLEAKNIALRGVDPTLLNRARTYVSSNPYIDLAVIQLPEHVFSDYQSIAIGTGKVLDDVMVLGYPDVPGFHPNLAAEKAMISSRFTAVRGTVASAPEEIFAQTSLLLITARVRGGFSGGPVLNSLGVCVGVVSREATSQSSSSDHHLYDNLGYGTAIPSALLMQIIEEADSSSLAYSRQLQAEEINWTNFE